MCNTEAQNNTKPRGFVFLWDGSYFSVGKRVENNEATIASIKSCRLMFILSGAVVRSNKISLVVQQTYPKCWCEGIQKGYESWWLFINHSSVVEHWWFKPGALVLSFYPAHACVKGLDNWCCCLSVYQSSEKFLNLYIDRTKQFPKLTVTLTL